MSILDTKKLVKEINILVLEDMEDVRTQLVSDLRTIGFAQEIYEAATLKEAKQFLDEGKKIDLFLCDWNLPDGEGIELLVKMKSMDQYKDMPFLMCTTRSEVNNILSAVEKGCNDYIVKPWNAKELEKKILSSL